MQLSSMLTMSDAVWLTDMRECLPPRNISSERRQPGCWKSLFYQTKGGPAEGHLIYSLYRNQALPVRLPLKQKGRYNIYVGIWNSSLSGHSLIRLKLSGDPCYTVIWDNSDVHCLADHFLKQARLVGDDLHIAKIDTPYQSIAALAYVRLEPVFSQPEEKRSGKKYPLIVTHDGYSSIACSGLKTKEDLWQDIEVFRKTDFKKIFYCIGGADLTTYPTRYGTVIASKAKDFPEACESTFAESLKELIRQKINPLRCVSDYAQKVGIEFQIYIRTQAFAMDPPYEETFSSDFFRQNPRWRCLSRDGRKTNQMSYAFPGVRAHLLDILREALAITDAAGINLTFVRGGPCVLYEDPVLKAFRQETGLNARRLKLDDERFLKFKARYVTGFIRETRTLLDSVKRDGKRKELSVHVYGDRRTNLMNGFDVEDWADRKMVDFVVVWPQATNMQYHYNKGKVGYLAKADYRYFHRICSRNKIPFYLCILTGVNKTGGALIRMVQDAYHHGVDGLVFWDGDGAFTLPAMRQVAGRMGDKEWVMSLNSGKFIKPVTFPLKELGGFMMDRYWSWMGF